MRALHASYKKIHLAHRDTGLEEKARGFDLFRYLADLGNVHFASPAPWSNLVPHVLMNPACLCRPRLMAGVSIVQVKGEEQVPGAEASAASEDSRPGVCVYGP